MWHTTNKNDCGRFTYSQEPAEESSQTFCLDTYLSELAKSRITQEPSSCKDNEMESCQSSQSGTTSQPSMENLGADSSMLSRVDSLARIYRQQVKAQGLEENDQGSGEKWRESLTRYDPDTASWKTHQCLLLGGLESFSEIFPKWGMMRTGECWGLTMSAHLIEENESGLWPTPTVAEATKIPATANYGQIGLNNHPRIRGLPTREKMGKDRKGLDGGKSTPQIYLTPTRSDYRSPNLNPAKSGQKVEPSSGHALPARVGGQLNPSWVEWLMGWPIEWTDLKPLGMDKFHKWLASHGKS